MFDNVAFNVVLGLVLIYLLYSLLVTILGEMIATWLGMRNRILRLGIERMLNDGYYKTQPKVQNNKPQAAAETSTTDKTKAKKATAELGWWQRLFLKESTSFKHSFAGRFYAYPSIKYLAKLEEDQQGLFGQTKPAYISAENFADTLIHMLSDKGRGHSLLERLRFSLRFNTCHIEHETIKHLRNLLVNSGDDLNVFRSNLERWFNDTMDRTNGWYKNHVRIVLFLLGLLIAATFNVDTIRVAGILANDKEARNQLVSAGVALGRDTSSAYRSIVNGKGDNSNPVLDTGLARVTRDLSGANLILGLGWDCSNLYKSEIDTVLKTQKEGEYTKISEKIAAFERNQHHTLSSSYIDSLADVYAAICWGLDTLNRNFKRLKLDTARSRLDLAVINVKDTAGRNKWQRAHQVLITRLAVVRRTIQMDSSVYSLDSFDLRVAEKEIRATLQFIDTTLGSKFRIIDSVVALPDSAGIVLIGRRGYAWWETFLYALGHSFYPDKFLGFLLTAIALSLGAPFWFDLLNKLASLRGSGIKPEDKAPPSNKVDMPENPIADPHGSAVPPIAVDVVDQFLQDHGADLRSIPGVKSLFKTFDPVNKIFELQINVADAPTENLVRGKLPLMLVNMSPFSWSIVISGTPASHVSGLPGEIANESGLNGSGSLGCILLDDETKKKHVLSCWHVLKGNTDYDNPDTSFTIIDGKSDPLATRWAGGIKGCFDFGMAELLPEKTSTDNSVIFDPLKLNNVKWKPLTNAQINSREAVKFMDCFTGARKDGIILCDTPSVEIHYADKVRIVEDVLVLTDTNTGTTISQEGNSGALVFDATGAAVAMIIAGDLKYTYCMKLSNFFGLYKEMKIA